jgi:hypothetical protein
MSRLVADLLKQLAICKETLNKDLKAAGVTTFEAPSTDAAGRPCPRRHITEEDWNKVLARREERRTNVPAETVTVAEAARLLAMEEYQVYNLIAANQLTPVETGEIETRVLNTDQPDRRKHRPAKRKVGSYCRPGVRLRKSQVLAVKERIERELNKESEVVSRGWKTADDLWEKRYSKPPWGRSKKGITRRSFHNLLKAWRDQEDFRDHFAKVLYKGKSPNGKLHYYNQAATDAKLRGKPLPRVQTRQAGDSAGESKPAGPATGENIPAATNGGDKALSPVERALIIYTRDPNQSIRKIARQAGCSHAALLKNEKFKRLRQTHQGSLPTGTKSRDGDLEAEADD